MPPGKLHSLELFFFGFSRGYNTLFWKDIYYDFRVFQNIQDKPRSFSEVFIFPQPPCLFFFWNRLLIDRQTFCSGFWDTLPSALSYNVFLNLSKIKSVTDYIQNICLSPHSQQFICLQSESFTPFLISWRKLTECYSKLLPTIPATRRLFSCTFHESINIDVS